VVPEHWLELFQRQRFRRFVFFVTEMQGVRQAEELMRQTVDPAKVFAPYLPRFRHQANYRALTN